MQLLKADIKFGIKHMFDDYSMNIADLQNLGPDSIIYRTHKINIADPEFLPKYYNCWLSEPNFTMEFAELHFKDAERLYSYNLTKVDPMHIAFLHEQANLNELSGLNKKAIITRGTDLRGIPTREPMFEHHSRLGDGYPYDVMQVDYLRIGQPILVSHFSKDQEFAFVATSYTAMGWIDARNFQYVDNNTVRWLLGKAHGVFIKDDVPLVTQQGYLDKSKIGMVLAIDRETDQLVSVIMPENGEFTNIYISNDIFRTLPLTFSEENVKLVLEGLLGEPYGWGSLYDHRDCSKFLQDYYSCFGRFIPRNSYDQYLQAVNKVELEEYSHEEKIATIKSKAIPFASSILLKGGHIVLYLGSSASGDILVASNLSTIKTFHGNERQAHLIGKALVHSLEIGKELDGFDQAKTSHLGRAKAIINYATK